MLCICWCYIVVQQCIYTAQRTYAVSIINTNRYREAVGGHENAWNTQVRCLIKMWTFSLFKRVVHIVTTQRRTVNLNGGVLWGLSVMNLWILKTRIISWLVEWLSCLFMWLLLTLQLPAWYVVASCSCFLRKAVGDTHILHGGRDQLIEEQRKPENKYLSCPHHEGRIGGVSV